MGYKLDLSEWQGDVDFSRVAKVASLVTLRVQAGSSHADTKYQTYAAGCVANNLYFGSYAYGKYVSVPDAIQESNDCDSRLHPNSKYVVVDIETMCLHNPADIVPATQAFIDNLHAKGHKKVGLYTGEYFYKQYGLEAVKCDFLWLAKYPANDNGTFQPASKPSTPCDLWQFTEKGHADGIPTVVDGSELVGSKPLSYFTGESTPSSSPIIQVVKVLQNTDIRALPNHTSGYVGEAVKDHIYNVVERSGDWHKVILDNNGHLGWIDGNGGQNLFWIH